MALTKKQKEFFDRFSRNILINTLVMRLQQGGAELDDETVVKLGQLIEQTNVDSLSTAAGEKLLSMVDFATLVRVEKYLTSPETKKALEAAQKVGIALQAEVYAILEQIFLAEPTEK